MKVQSFTTSSDEPCLRSRSSSPSASDTGAGLLIERDVTAAAAMVLHLLETSCRKIPGDLGQASPKTVSLSQTELVMLSTAKRGPIGGELIVLLDDHVMSVWLYAVLALSPVDQFKLVRGVQTPMNRHKCGQLRRCSLILEIPPDIFEEQNAWSSPDRNLRI